MSRGRTHIIPRKPDVRAGDIGCALSCGLRCFDGTSMIDKIAIVNDDADFDPAVSGLAPFESNGVHVWLT